MWSVYLFRLCLKHSDRHHLWWQQQKIENSILCSLLHFISSNCQVCLNNDNTNNNIQFHPQKNNPRLSLCLNTRKQSNLWFIDKIFLSTLLLLNKSIHHMTSIFDKLDKSNDLLPIWVIKKQKNFIQISKTTSKVFSLNKKTDQFVPFFKVRSFLFESD